MSDRDWEHNYPGRICFWIVFVLYVPYFFLPVFPAISIGRGEIPGEYIRGWQGVFFCCMIPQFWPVIIGHFAIWVGLVSLQDGRGRRAASMGIVALMASFWSWIFLVEFLEKGRFDCTIGLWAKLFAIVALIVCGVRLEREKPRELQSGKTPDKSGQGSISDQHESPE